MAPFPSPSWKLRELVSGTDGGNVAALLEVNFTSQAYLGGTAGLALGHSCQVSVAVMRLAIFLLVEGLASNL